MKKLLMALVLMPMTVMAVADNGLVHRWSFNGNLTDSVGGITAAVVGNVTTDGKQYILAGGSRGSSYVDLGTGILPTNGDGMTLEIWARRNGEGRCSRIFDIGSGDSDYLMWSWMNVDSTSDDNLSVYALCGISDVHTGVGFAQGVEYHISVVARKTEEGVWIFTFQKRNNSTGSLIASQQVSSAEKSWQLSDLGQSSCWLGHSQWPSDDDAAASYNEVRIWNRALSESELSENVRLGPDVLPENAEGANPDSPSANPDSVIVKNVTARQVYPWSDIVEIKYEIESVGALLDAELTLDVELRDEIGGKIFSAKSFSTQPTFTNGVNTVFWHPSLDGYQISSTSLDVHVRVVLITYSPYCIVDLSSGPTASRYGVSWGGADVDVQNEAYAGKRLLLRRIQAGTFAMGDVAHGDWRLDGVRISKAFYIGTFEITQRQWELVTNGRPSFFSKAEYYGNRPVENVSYTDIRGAHMGLLWPSDVGVDDNSFIGKLKAKTGLSFDLPTSAQWEYACRAGTMTDYGDGSNGVSSDADPSMSQVGRYYYNGGYPYDLNGGYSTGTARVGSYRPNLWGLYDMHGNVEEWCLNRTGTSGYELWGCCETQSYQQDPVGPFGGEYRLIRGGGLYSHASDCRSFYGTGMNPNEKREDVGFRVVINGDDDLGVVSRRVIGECSVSSCDIDMTQPVAIEYGTSIEVPYDIRHSFETGCVSQIVLSYWDVGGYYGETNKLTAISIMEPGPLRRSSGVCKMWFPHIGTYEIKQNPFVQGTHVSIDDWGRSPVVMRSSINGVEYSPCVACEVWSTAVELSSGDIPLREYLPTTYRNVKVVSFDDSVRHLDDRIFADCQVERIVLPNSLESFSLAVLPQCMQAALRRVAYDSIVYENWLLEYLVDVKGCFVVPNGIVGIGQGVFSDMYHLEEVRMPSTLQAIGKEAFRNCTLLDNVIIPDSVETIGESAFEDCSWMQTITFGTGLKKIGKNAFRGCTQLQKVVFQEGLCEIEDGAFDGCWRLQSVSLPLSVSNVCATAFSGCSGLTGVTMPTHLGTVSSWFKPVCTKIKNVTIVAGETQVADNMFAGCSELESVVFAERIGGVRTIGKGAFWNCSKLSGITPPESLREVGAAAFMGCTALSAIVLPSGVSSLGASVFENCTALSDVTLSPSLTSIPDRAFYGCDSLDSFTVPESVIYLGSQIVGGSSSYWSGYGTSAIYFLGDAPSYAYDVYGAARSDLTSYIVYGTRGWDGRVMSRDIPQQWPTDTAAQRNILTWSPNPFDVTFDAAGGLFVNDGSTIYACQQITYAAYALPPYNPMRSGYIFNGWWTERTGGTQVTPSVRVVLTKAHTLYAHWTAAGEIRVRFNATGGTVIPEDGSYLSAAPFGEMPVPTMEYWDFDGWWTQPSGGTRVTEASEVPAADVELFAHWVPARYKIIFHAENGSSYDTTRTQTFTYGETVTLDRNRWSCASATFGGWALEPGGRAVYADEKVLTDLSAIRNGELHLYAVWIGDTYAVRFDSNGGVGRMNDQTMVIGVSYNLHTNCFTRANYTFQGWAEKANGSKKYADGARIYNGFAAAKGDTVVLYAVWRKITSHSVTYDANGGVCTTVKRTYSTATVGSIPTATRTGYAFLGWYTAKQGGEKLTVETILPASVTYFARWAPIRGIVGIVSPYPLEARAGRTVRFAFAREGDARGSIAVKVKTQTSTALIGTGPENGDLLYVKQILEWADGDTSDKYIDVPIYGTGIGKQFRFKLATMATGAYDGNVVPALEEAKIYVPIVGATPGMIALTQPDPLEAHENTTCRVGFSRYGGSSGSIAVKVKSQTSTATLYSSATPWGQVGYVKEILEWRSGETGTKYVDIPVYDGGAGLQFRLKLAPMSTGVYNGNLVPEIPETKIYVPIEECSRCYDY